jgi:hypothetical protein
MDVVKSTLVKLDLCSGGEGLFYGAQSIIPMLLEERQRPRFAIPISFGSEDWAYVWGGQLTEGTHNVRGARFTQGARHEVLPCRSGLPLNSGIGNA